MPTSMVDLVVPGDVQHLATLRDRVEAFCEELGQPPTFTMAVMLSVDEAATNVVLHGYDKASGDVRLEAWVDAGVLWVRLTDAAPPYDPTGAPTPNLDAPIEERQIGGLGVHLIRANMDTMTYRLTEQGGNELTLTKRLVAP